MVRGPGAAICDAPIRETGGDHRRSPGMVRQMPSRRALREYQPASSRVPLVTALAIECDLSEVCELIEEQDRGGAMNKDIMSQAEADDKILTFDVLDEALERAGGADQSAVTWVYCTHAYHYCDWPQ